MRKISRLLMSLSFLILLNFGAYAVEIDWDAMGQANQTQLVNGSSLAPSLNVCSPGQVNCDVIAAVTYEIVNDGQGGELECLWDIKTVCARFYDEELGGIDDGNLRFGLNATGADNNDYLNICVEFDRLTEGLTFDILDVDEIGWDDVVELYYTSTPSATPMLARNDLVNGWVFGDISTGVDANRVLEHNPNLPAPNNEATGWGAIQPGGGNATSNDDGGNITIDFTSTPVWGFCIRYWAGPNSSADPPAQSIGLSALTWTSSTPVNLDEFSSDKVGSNVNVSWSTSSETFNLGFNLWVEIDGNWQSVNERIIPSHIKMANSRLQYYEKIKLSRKLSAVRRIGISSIDVTGQEEFYGPFDIGKSYGQESMPEPIDWQQVKSDYEYRMRRKGFLKRNEQWIFRNRVFQNNGNRINLEVAERGIVRVTHEDLMLNEIDLRGIYKDEIAVTHRGESVSRYIYVGNKQNRFDEASFIDFYAEPVGGEIALYNSNNVYQIIFDPEHVLEARLINAPLRANSLTSSIVRSINYEEDHIYYNVSTVGSPWLDTSIGWGTTASIEKEFSLPNDHLLGTAIEITVNLMGGFDFPKAQEDHKLQVFVNEQFLGERVWGGFEAQSFVFSVSAESLVGGKNKLKIRAVPTEVGVALIYLDKYSVSYQAQPYSQGTSPRFKLSRSDAKLAIELERNSNERLWAYASGSDGELVRLKYKNEKANNKNSIGADFLILPTINTVNADYWLLTDSQFIKPSMLIAPNVDIEVDQASLYIIADEAFIGDELNGYVDFKRAEGIATELLSYQSLLAQYGHGFNDPYVIRSFLKQQGVSVGDTSILLVGGHTFDYLDRTKTGSVSFIPAAYRGSRVIQYSPTDSPLVDLDLDGLPDIAVGRWPVRTVEQLSVIIDKSRSWALGEGLARSTSVLLIADNDDRNNALSFSNQLDSLALQFDSSSKIFPSFWGDVNRVYATDYQNALSPVMEQRLAIKDLMTLGSALTIYNGHGSPVSWSSAQFFNVNSVDSIAYQSGANIVIPLACYTTYYETISNESLANKLLFKKNGGAVAIAGAATIGDYQSNAKIFAQMMRQNAQKNELLGESLRLAKRSMGLNKIAQANLWTLLADPTLQYNPRYQMPTGNLQDTLEE